MPSVSGSTRLRSTALPAALALTIFSTTASAQEAAPRQDLTAVPVVRSFNLVGIGVGVLPEFSGSRDPRALVLPVIRASWKDKVFINALQGGVWLLDSDDKTFRFGLAVEPRFGWEAKDGTLVAGMERREFSLEAGPNLQLRTPVGVVNANWYQDISGASNGQTAQLQFIRSLINLQGGSLRLNGVAGAQWFAGKTNDYYFGVRPSEATAQRPAYTAGSTVNLQLGVNGVYLLGRGSLLFGAIGNWLGNEAAQSPIVETRFQPIVYVGYGINF
jgi:outer membrane protein